MERRTPPKVTVRPCRPEDREAVARIHDIARLSARIECTVLAGNDHARALYESAGFTVIETKTGKLAGNERFAATGHVMEWHRP
ncbi:hypothetical protein ACIP5L_05410 [Streptomyces bacillaris]|uniref:hypothetical protein n=1 Tax=Streptomyces bacillaris TaxID=68179 RepID=UPI0038236E5A